MFNVRYGKKNMITSFWDSSCWTTNTCNYYILRMVLDLGSNPSQDLYFMLFATILLKITKIEKNVKLIKILNVFIIFKLVVRQNQFPEHIFNKVYFITCILIYENLKSFNKVVSSIGFIKYWKLDFIKKRLKTNQKIQIGIKDRRFPEIWTQQFNSEHFCLFNFEYAFSTEFKSHNAVMFFANSYIFFDILI